MAVCGMKKSTEHSAASGHEGCVECLSRLYSAGTEHELLDNVLEPGTAGLIFAAISEGWASMGLQPATRLSPSRGSSLSKKETKSLQVITPRPVRSMSLRTRSFLRAYLDM